MKLLKICLRASTSLLLVMTMTTVFSLSSFAAPQPDTDTLIESLTLDPAFVQEPSGILNGSATVNDIEMESGATITSGSKIETGSSSAVIDLGPLGRIEIRPHTSIVLVFAAGMVSIKNLCSPFEVDVVRGQAQVREGSDAPETRVPGEDEELDESGEVTTTGGTNLILDCDDDPAAYIGPGLGGILGMIGVGAAIFVGIALGDETDSFEVPPPISPMRP